MLIKGINLPEELLHARDAEDLVIFAGAGVSCPPPSSLPLFKGLAERIGEDTRFQLGESEPFDRYLGRLKQNQVRVHELAANILINDSTKPHELHQLLIELFGGAERIRLVTTNFDTHFTTAVTKKFSSGVETFFAPALPLGDDFAGLVYLHGCAKKPIKCVLTDEDFGRAYLTQAWASRFLQAMFLRYTVLFVGYSHDDPVMNYLARGLPPQGKRQRFAFTTEDQTALSKWRFLGIRPVTYQKCSGENEHQAITDTVREWVLESNRGLLEKSQRIQSIASARPPLEGEDADYIKQSLGVIETARIFFKCGNSPEWLSWMEKHEILQPIFKTDLLLTQIQQEIAFWVIETFLDRHPQEVFAALARNGGRLNANLCWWLWRRLAMRDRKSIDGTIFRQSVAVLLSHPADVLSHDNWALLLKRCKFPEDKFAALGLFSRITKPRTIVKKSWLSLMGSEDNKQLVNFEIDIADHGHVHSFDEAWREFFRPNLADCACDLEPIIISNLTEASTLSVLSRQFDRNRDPFYPHRQSIHPHEQDSLRTGTDTLIDAARDVLNHMIGSTPHQAATRIEQWFGSDVAILRRLAVYGTGRRTDLQSDEKLLWVEKNNLLFEFKTDIFQLLKDNYPNATEPIRKRILDLARQGRPATSPLELDDNSKIYEVFNLVAWLRRIAPDCELTASALNTLREAHPQFREREHPELNVWTSSGGFGFVSETEGFDLDLIAAQPPATFLDLLLNWRPRQPMDKDRASYCSAASAVVAKKPMWGIEWAQNLNARNLSDADLWSCICQGWRNASMDSDTWGSLLNFVATIDGAPTFFSAFADVLGNGARREKFAIPDTLMENAQRVAVRIWHVALTSTPEASNAYHDWLTTAINDPGGRIAEFWLQRISFARKSAGDSWQGLPPGIAEEMKKIIRSHSGAGAMARVYFTSQLHYFYSLDATFAKTELIPLFNWESNDIQAEQSWSGFLFWGRWMPDFRELLLPHFNKIIEHKTRLSESGQENLIHHIAIVSIFLLDDPLANDWLLKIFEHLDEESRANLAGDLTRYLQDVETTIAESIWERWLKRFWKKRLLNVPVPILPKEVSNMVILTLSLGSHFPESVTIVKDYSGNIQFGHAPIFYVASKNLSQLRLYPDTAAELILLYLRSPIPFFYADDHVTAVWKALCETTVSRDKLKTIREAMLAKGHDPGEPPQVAN